MAIKIFQRISELEVVAFICTPEYMEIAADLRLMEWTPVVWIGRLFLRDNDFGEHWHDNHDLREAAEEWAKRNGITLPDQELLIICPEFFYDHLKICYRCKKKYETFKCECGNDVWIKPDGPCHTDDQRMRFWHDVMDSLCLSLETLIDEARHNHEMELKLLKYNNQPDYNFDIEAAIAKVREKWER